MDEQKVISLRKAIKFGEETYTSITLREPTAGEVKRSMDTGEGMGQLVALISAVAAVPFQVVEKMGFRDFKEAAAYVALFTGDGPVTG